MEEDNPPTLLPPAILAIKEDEATKSGTSRTQMLRSTSADMREEGKELQRAAEQSYSTILAISLDGLMRWTSPSWLEIVGTPFDKYQGKPVADIVIDNKDVFSEATEAMKENDTGSKNVRFAIYIGPQSVFWTSTEPNNEVVEEEEKPPEMIEEHVLNLEGQGIMVYDRESGLASHTMWLIRPWVQREVTIDLPDVLVESLGEGAELLAQHLTELAEAGREDLENVPSPLPVLCRICERQITFWWFPKHTELCLQEHEAEAEVQRTQENLTDHRNAIVKVLDGLEALTRHNNTQHGERASTPPVQPEYKGVLIGPTASPASSPPSSNVSGRASPASPITFARDYTPSHSRPRSFTVRRPLARIVELVLDLCDTALEINQPAIKDNGGQDDGEFRTLSPSSEGRISQVIQWQSPSAGALENEAGVAALCEDTEKLSKAKVDAVRIHRRILEYSERIRSEYTSLVQECIDAALQKAARIADGDISSASSDTSSIIAGETDDNELDKEVPPASDTQSEIESQYSTTEQTRVSETSTEPRAEALYQAPPYEGRSAMATALRQVSDRSPSPGASPSRRVSSPLSTRSSSPKAPPTPKSYTSSQFVPPPTAESDAGAESDDSRQSSVRSHQLTGPSSWQDSSMSRFTSRERKRTSLILPRATSVSRQESPARMSISGQPVSPLRVSKPRLPSNSAEHSRSPMMSPTVPSSEFHSPILPAQNLSSHRRESSAASSEISKNLASPRVSLTNNPQQRAMVPSIRDFEIIKPISKGAFGSVYLAKKKSTGDYYAIKALKKADMVSKNQVANVKAERAILMWQGESDFVAKLYWTFPSKDYIFLVMEYLNGGDCASLVQALGTLPEDWAKRYIAEVVEGVDHLHSREIVHRDLKPDNLLIDQKGHLKLTDFGLSKMGLIGRQKRALNAKPNQAAPDPLKQGPFIRSTSMSTSRSASYEVPPSTSPGHTPSLTPVYPTEIGQPSYFSLGRESGSMMREPTRQSSMSQHSDAGENDQLRSAVQRLSLYDDPWANRESPKEDTEEGYFLNQTTSNASNPKASTPPTGFAGQGTSPGHSMPPPPMALFDPEDSNRRFVGTPDYLAPETINGLGQDEMSDWWSLGCILFEFLYGYPPFHGDTPDEVFENILSRKIDWPQDDDGEVSEEAKDLMNRLMCLDPNQRLGANVENKYASGGEEIRKHPWFIDIDWNTLNEVEASFVPAPQNPEDTEYFDPRGATNQDFAMEFEDQGSSPQLTPGTDYERPHDALAKVRAQANSNKRGLMPLHIPPHVRDSRSRRLSEPVAGDDFGQFSFKNLPMLEKANKDVIQKLRAEAMHAQTRSMHGFNSSAGATAPTPSLESSPVIGTTLKRAMSTASRGNNRSVSPANLSHLNSSPSRTSQPPSPLVQFSAGTHHHHHHERRKTSSEASMVPIAGGSLQPANLFDFPRLSTNVKNPSTSSSPVKSVKSSTKALEKTVSASSAGSPRARSHTVGSNDMEGMKEPVSNHQKRHSQALDISPSSSDTDDTRQKAFLRVQRRRQSTKRLSQVNLTEGPVFRPLDVLVCEDHPVSRLVMEKLLEKLRCRAIMVSNGADAMRYAMGSIKFDIIMMEFKLPQINGADVARMLRETRNPNSHTPIVAVTGYLKELQAPHHFDSLIEKPPTITKFTEVLGNLCQWKPPPPGWTPIQQQQQQQQQSMPMPMPPSGLRKQSLPMDESPSSTTTTTSGFNKIPSSSYRGSSREDSMSSTSVFTDADSKPDDVSVVVTEDFDQWSHVPRGLGLGIMDESNPERMTPTGSPPVAALQHHDSAPAALETKLPRKRPSAEAIEAKKKAFGKDRAAGGESGDDEDEELGQMRVRSRSPQLKPYKRPTSKLGTEMLRTDSQGSETSTADSGVGTIVPAPSPPPLSDDATMQEDHQSATTPPIVFPKEPGEGVIANIDMEATPTQKTDDPALFDLSPTPKPVTKLQAPGETITTMNNQTSDASTSSETQTLEESSTKAATSTEQTSS